MNTVQPESGPQLQTRLAVERTLLAWVRTGLAMMGFGFIVARFGLFLREMAATRRENERLRQTPPRHPRLLGARGLHGPDDLPS